jgi:DNA-binding response OmpR family regulator
MARILAVDDEPAILDLIKESLDGHEVSTATDGSAGLAAVRASPPDLVILDVAMPGMTGLAVCRAIKEDPSLSAIPVLLLTGGSRIGEVEQGFRAKADDYIVKPFSPRVLAGRVDQLLRKRR